MQTSLLNEPLVSVVIPVKNGIDTLASCLDGIFGQTLRDKLEVIIIDSGSTDGTLDLLKKYPVRVYNLPPKEFNHGETRNLGVALCNNQPHIEKSFGYSIKMIFLRCFHFIYNSFIY